MSTVKDTSRQNGTNNVVLSLAVPLQNTAILHGEKLKKFGSVNFKRWQQKMLFYLTTQNLVKFLKETTLTIQEEENNRKSIIALDVWKHSDFLYKNYILNGLDNTLYRVSSSKNSANDMWDSLEKKYKTEDAETKKFIVSKFLDYRMVDSKTVISQVQELQVLLHDIHAEKMELSESFQVASIIEKLPQMWRDFKNYLKHKSKDMNLKELIVRLRIEEDNRKIERRPIVQLGANFVETNTKIVNKKRKIFDDVPRRDNSKKTKKVQRELLQLWKGRTSLKRMSKLKEQCTSQQG